MTCSLKASSVGGSTVAGLSVVMTIVKRNSSNVSTSLPFLPYESNALLCAILTLSARLYLYSWTVFKVDSMPIFVTSSE